MPETENKSAKDNSLEFFLKHLWDKRAQGLNLPDVDIFRNITHENIVYLLNLYPFLQLVSTAAMFIGEVEPQFIKAQSGWIIHDYGEAMSSSLGNLLFTGADYHSLPLPKDLAEIDKLLRGEKDFANATDEDNGGDGGDDDKGGGDKGLNPGKGTIIKQAFDTAMEMVSIAKQKAWPGISIVAGTPIMEWAAWLAAEEYGMEVMGYTADKKAEAKRQRVKQQAITFPSDKFQP